MKILGVVAACALALSFGALPAKADTVSADISDLAGFTRPGGVWESATYTFQPGTTVNFGTALIFPYSQCFNGNCTVQGSDPQLFVFFGTRPTNSVISQTINDATSFGAIFGCVQPKPGCGDGSHVTSNLLVSLGSESMVTFLFTGGGPLTIIPPEGALPYQPPAVPLPGALPLFATGLGVLGLLGWRRKRTTRKLLEAI